MTSPKANSFGPGNQPKPKKANLAGRPPKNKVKDPLSNALMGGTPAANPMGAPQMDFGMGTPAANPMGTPQMDFGMGNMGGMQMNAPSPTGGGDYGNFMAGMMDDATQHGEKFGVAGPAYTDPSGSGRWGIDDTGPIDQPTGMAGFSGAARGPGMVPGDDIGGGYGGYDGGYPTRPGDRVSPDDPRWDTPGGDPIINNMGGVQSPQGFGWDDPAMGGFPMGDPMMGDPMMGYAGGPQADFSGGSMPGPSMDSPPTVNQYGEEVVPSGSREYEEAMERELAQGGAYDEMPAVDPTVGLEEPLPDVQPPIEDTIIPPEPEPEPEAEPEPEPDAVEQFAEVGEAAFEDEDERKPGTPHPKLEEMKGTFWDIGGKRTPWKDLEPQAKRKILYPGKYGDTKLKQWVDKPEDPKEATPPTVEPEAPTDFSGFTDDPVAPTVPKASAYPAMVRDESGNMVIDPDYQSGKIKDYREMPVAPTVSRPPTGVSSAMPPAVKDESGNWTVPPDWQSGKLTDTPEPVEPKREPAWEGWGSISPDRKEPFYEKYGKARVEEYVKTHGGNVPPFDEWDKEIQDKPALEEFKDKVDAGEVSDEEPADKKPEQVTVDGKKYWKESDRGKPGVPEFGMFTDGRGNVMGIDPPAPRQDEPTGIPPKEPVSEGADKFSEVGDASYGEADTGSDSKEDVMKPENWDTSGGQYTYKGAEFGKSNTNPPADTEDWANTRQEAASGADDAIGTASSESRSAAQEADLGLPDMPTTGQGIDESDLGIPSAPGISFPPSYKEGEGQGSQSLAGEYHEFPGREYDVDPDELYDEYGKNLMGKQGIVSRLPEGVLGIRRRGETPAQMRIRRNNAVAQAYQNMNQGLGGMTGALPGMSRDVGSYAQQGIGPQVAARMAAGQAQLDIERQYDMQYAEQVRQRRELEHRRGIEEANMTVADYYDNLGNLIESGNTDNRITQWAAAQMPDQFA